LNWQIRSVIRFSHSSNAFRTIPLLKMVSLYSIGDFASRSERLRGSIVPRSSSMYRIQLGRKGSGILPNGIMVIRYKYFEIISHCPNVCHTWVSYYIYELGDGARKSRDLSSILNGNFLFSFFWTEMMFAAFPLFDLVDDARKLLAWNSEWVVVNLDEDNVATHLSVF
jgi:hypothetical protein